MLIPSYVIQLIYQNQNVTELDINWLLGKKQANTDIWKLSPQSHISLYLIFFDKKHTKPPRQISMAGTL